jgi:glyoxalase-like protein
MVRSRFLRLALSLLLVPGARLSGQVTQSSDVGLDHIILATPSLNWGILEFARLTGVTPKRGGQHPGRGTENALVSLGAGRYLELLAPLQPRDDSAAPRFRPAGWAVHTTALSALIDRIQAAGFALTGPVPGSRRTTDSTLLQWRTASTGGPGLELAPFLIEWAEGTAHPSTTSPTGCQLVSLELVTPDTTRLEAFLRAVKVQVGVRPGAAISGRLTIDCPTGRVAFSSDRP